MPTGPQRLPRIEPGVPPEFGSTPIPSGMVRFNHYTRSPESAKAILSEGILRKHSEEAFARGGTESPQVFMSAGRPEKSLMNTRTVIEGWADPKTQLDVGSNWRGTDPEEHAADVEGRRGTITAHGDIPASQIIGAHEPWHDKVRYLARPENVDMEKNIMGGNYDDIEPDLDKALRVAKTALAAKVMTGGKLEGKQWE